MDCLNALILFDRAICVDAPIADMVSVEKMVQMVRKDTLQMPWTAIHAWKKAASSMV